MIVIYNKWTSATNIPESPVGKISQKLIKPFRHVYIKSPVDILVFALRLLALEVLHNSCNMGTCDLPEITRDHVTTIKYRHNVKSGIYESLRL